MYLGLEPDGDLSYLSAHHHFVLSNTWANTRTLIIAVTSINFAKLIKFNCLHTRLSGIV